MAAAAGFSLVELLVVAAIALSVMASTFALVRNVQFGFTREGERADMQQRLRVAGGEIHGDLVMAGAGAYGASGGPLNFYVAAVLPFRQGAQDSDPAGTFRPDTITILHVPRTTSPQTTIRQSMGAGSGTVSVNMGAGCLAGNPACGFSAGMDVVVYDETPSYDMFRVLSVQGEWLELRHDMVDAPHQYAAGAYIAEAESHTYHLKTDPTTGAPQLMRYGARSDAAIADHVVGLSLKYYGDPLPPVLVRPLADPIGPWTTYGPKPPPADKQVSLYPAGENCVFRLDASGTQPIPRLAVLGAGASASLVELTADELTDGPWCPDAADSRRFDADLLRIRRIDVTVRVEAALSSLRGPAGRLFTRGGTSRTGERWLPDLQLEFAVTPRNLNVGQ